VYWSARFRSAFPVHRRDIAVGSVTRKDKRVKVGRPERIKARYATTPGRSTLRPIVTTTGEADTHANTVRGLGPFVSRSNPGPFTRRTIIVAFLRSTLAVRYFSKVFRRILVARNISDPFSIWRSVTRTAKSSSMKVVHACCLIYVETNRTLFNRIPTSLVSNEIYSVIATPDF